MASSFKSVVNSLDTSSAANVVVDGENFVFTSRWEYSLGFNHALITVSVGASTATSTCKVYAAAAPTTPSSTVRGTLIASKTLTASVVQSFRVPISDSFFRVELAKDGTGVVADVHLSTILHRSAGTSSAGDGVTFAAATALDRVSIVGTPAVSLASTTITGSVAVTGAFFQATQPVSIAATVPVSIAGTVATTHGAPTYTQSYLSWPVVGGVTAYDSGNGQASFTLDAVTNIQAISDIIDLNGYSSITIVSVWISGPGGDLSVQLSGDGATWANTGTTLTINPSQNTASVLNLTPGCRYIRLFALYPFSSTPTVIVFQKVLS